MKFFSKKQLRTVRSPIQKAKEQQGKLDAHLAAVYLDDLKAHPEYARMVAREKFGMPEIPSHTDDGNFEVPTDLMDVLRQAKEAKNLLRDELGEEKGGLFRDLLRALPAIPATLQSLQGVMPQMQQMQPMSQLQMEAPTPRLQQPQPQQPTQPQPTQPQQPQPDGKPSVEEQQQGLINFANRLLSMEPATVAKEIYDHRDEEGNVMAIAWQNLDGQDFDSIVEMLPMISAIPGYDFLQPVLDKIDKKWLALVFDELMTLKDQEPLVKEA